MPSTEPTPSTIPAIPTRELDALPRLDARTRRRSVEVAAATPGSYLLVEDGAERRLIPLTPEATSLGRGLSADIVLHDHSVSRRHALVVVRAGRTRVLDDRSTNGTWVNGRRVDEADLTDGDVLVLGRVVLTFSVVGAQAPAV